MPIPILEATFVALLCDELLPMKAATEKLLLPN
jgi:hypothetical protein